VATVLTHAALPLLGGRVWRPAEAPPRKLAAVAVVLSLLPDLDYVGLLFDVRPDDALGHRGLSHSLFVSLGLALLGALLFPKARRQTFLFLFACAASHPLVDALSRGDGGVALLAPLTAHRFVIGPLLPSIPLGINEAFGKWGALVLLAELLCVWTPLLLISGWRRPELTRRRRANLTYASVGWLVLLATLMFLDPPLFGRVPTPLVTAASYEGIPLHDGKLVTRFDDLKQAGVLDRPLAQDAVPWSSTFFPSWFGAEAGRWQDSKLTLVSRTLFGFHGPFEPRSPTEKYDVAVGDAKWTSTEHALKQSHNGKPRFWFGLCNGVGAAALQYPEPFRTVDVTAPNGATVRFHPQDVKALLAAANYWNASIVEMGDRCDVVKLDQGQGCSMNPATLVVALTNRLGLAKSSFLVDVHPTPQNQYYPVATATVRVTRPPYPLGDVPLGRALKGKVEQLTEVEVHLVLSSTTLGYAPANIPEGNDGTRFKKVGLHEVPFTWNATLALGAESEILGGRWSGTPAVGPDSIAFLSGGPLLTDGGMVDFNPGLKWSVVEALARASVDEGAAAPSIDVGGILDGGQ
jgi:inner membrane protein